MPDTLPRMVLRQARRLNAKTALRRKHDGQWRDIAWQQVEAQVLAFGRSLIALGIAPGDRVAVMAANCPEWAFADLGAMSCGALSVPVYHTEGIETVSHIVRDSGSRLLFLGSPLLAEMVTAELERMPELEAIVLFEGSFDHPRVLPLEDFLERGQSTPKAELEKRLAAGEAEATATIVYTSGTTGPPKGVKLTHRNFLSNIEAAMGLFAIGEADLCLSFLPLSHVFERMAGYYLMLHQGAVIAYAENFEAVPVNLAEVRPTVLVSVPRLYEKMHARVLERIISGSWLKKQIFFSALQLCRREVRRRLAGEQPGPLLQQGAALARRTVFAKLKQHLGGRLRFFVSGGAPLGKEIAEFFLAAGLPIYEGYGLTETSPVIAANTPQAQRLGTVGRPIPGTEVRIAEDGEILVRGPGVFQGYWQNPAADAAAFTGEWFHTGDIGEIDAEGYLAITDRKKDLIITAGGENIAPQILENRLKRDKFIANALVYGDGKPFLTALLVPDFEQLERYAHYKELDFLNHCDLVNHPRILDLIRRRIDPLQAPLPPIQRIKRFTLISRDFSSAEGEVTPTLKIKRRVVSRHFHQVLEGMYLAKGQGPHDAGYCVVANEEEAKGA